MWAAASGHSTLGIPRSVGREFANSDPGGHLPAVKRDDGGATLGDSLEDNLGRYVPDDRGPDAPLLYNTAMNADVPAKVQRYIGTAPSYAEGDIIPSPIQSRARNDLFAKEAQANNGTTQGIEREVPLRQRLQAVREQDAMNYPRSEGSRWGRDNWPEPNFTPSTDAAPYDGYTGTYDGELEPGPTRARGGGLAGKAFSLAHRMSKEQESAHKLREHFDFGGSPEIPYFERGEIRNVQYADAHPGGLVNTAGPGRTDQYNINVRSGSYVLPADVISGLGEGNSLAGANVIDRMLHSNPYGIQSFSHPRGGTGIPRPPRPYEEQPIQIPSAPRGIAYGGRTGFDEGGAPASSLPINHDNIIPVTVAGGEYIMTPEQVMAFTGKNDLDEAHNLTDQFIIEARKRAVDMTKKLPGPKKANEI